MRYCKKCTMPDTRPGITFDAEGVCSACRHYENRKNIDWDARFKEFEAYCDKYRGMNGPGGYDCAVAVSGGKDSHFQVWMLKEVMHMNPILFSVEDNGPGIAPEHIPRLTERFYRVDKARSRQTGGSGLGLAIVKHAVNHHDSRLEIDSTVGKGTRFSFLLPERLIAKNDA